MRGGDPAGLNRFSNPSRCCAPLDLPTPTSSSSCCHCFLELLRFVLHNEKKKKKSGVPPLRSAAPMLRRALSLSASYSAGLLRRPHASAPCCHLLLRPLDAPRFLPKKVAGEGKHTNVPAIWFSVVPATRNGAYNSLLDLNQRTGLLLGKRFVSTAVATGTTDPPGERFKCQHETRGRLCKTLEKRNILDHKRRLLASKYELRRKLHKAFCRDPDLPSDMRDKHRYKLSKLPKNSSFVRVRNRCISTGRPRSVYRLFRMSRIVFREKASQGSLMGIKKSSW